jgi:hypothetical protein
MAETWVHKQDTFNAVQDAVSQSGAELLRDIVHLVIDAQYTDGMKQELPELIARLAPYGITAYTLLQALAAAGVRLDLDSSQYGGDKTAFLAAWLLPPLMKL